MDPTSDRAIRPAPFLPDETELRAKKVRRFASGVSIVMMVVCNGIFLFGLWVTGTNFDRLVRTPDVYNAKQDICLRLAYRNVPGAENPVQFCSEWINLADSSGRTHTFQKETEIKQGADGKFYLDYGPLVDYRLFVVGAFVVIIVVFGILLKRHLVNRYRTKLETAAQQSAPLH
ncbi:hypothetical protein [Nitrospira sp. Nam80]